MVEHVAKLRLSLKVICSTVFHIQVTTQATATAARNRLSSTVPVKMCNCKVGTKKVSLQSDRTEGRTAGPADVMMRE